MSRTFEALQKAEHERKQGRREGAGTFAPGMPEPGGELMLEPPPAERQKAALDLDRSLQECLRASSAPVLLIPAVAPRRFAEVVLDTASSLTLRLALRCLVVDAGTRAPHLHRWAGVSRSRGMADLLSGRTIEVRHLTLSGTGGTVGFLPAGSGWPADEAWPERLAAWLDDQSRSFDRIFVAGPGTEEKETQVSLADATAGTVLVMPSGGARVRLPRKIETAIQTKILGIVAVG